MRRHEKALADARETLMRTIARISEARNQVHQIEVAVEKCEFYLGKLGESARKATESRDGARTLSAEWDQRVREAEELLESTRSIARARRSPGATS